VAGAAATATTLSGAAAAGPQASVTGVVTNVDPPGRTFTVRATDGKSCDFTATTNPPYEVISVR
jgi:hypothetical protein